MYRLYYTEGLDGFLPRELFKDFDKIEDCMGYIENKSWIQDSYYYGEEEDYSDEEIIKRSDFEVDKITEIEEKIVLKKEDKEISNAMEKGMKGAKNRLQQIIQNKIMGKEKIIKFFNDLCWENNKIYRFNVISLKSEDCPIFQKDIKVGRKNIAHCFSRENEVDTIVDGSDILVPSIELEVLKRSNLEFISSFIDKII